MPRIVMGALFALWTQRSFYNYLLVRKRLQYNNYSGTLNIVFDLVYKNHLCELILYVHVFYIHVTYKKF